MTSKQEEKFSFSKMGVTPEEAAAAATAQAIAFAEQNEVDAFRQQYIVNMVTMGTAYAKWLQNPGMGSEFSTIVDKTILRNTPANDKPGPVKGNDLAENYILPAKSFAFFLSSGKDKE